MSWLKALLKYKVAILGLSSVLVMGGTGIISTNLLISYSRDMRNASLPLFKISQMREQAILNNRYIFELILSDNEYTSSYIKHNIAQTTANFNSSFEEYKNAIQHADEIEFAEDIQKQWDNYLRMLDKVVLLVKQNKADDAELLAVNEIKPIFLNLRSTISNMILLDHQQAEAAFAASETLFDKINIVICALVISFALIIIALVIQLRIIERVQNDSQSLKQTINERDSLYSLIAHDLRSPFNAILGFIDLLQSSDSEINPDERKEAVNIVKSSANSYYNTLEDLLMWVQNSKGDLKITIAPTHIYKVIAEAFALHAELASGKNLTLVNDVPETLIFDTDSQMFRAIVRNLLSNAIKYSIRKGTITVTAKFSDGFLVLSVTDQGVGMSAKEVQAIINGEKMSSQKGSCGEKGFGLGINLCQQFASKLNGHLQCESKKGTGTTFTVALPVLKNDTIAQSTCE